MKKTCVLLSGLILALGVATNPNLTNVCATVDPFDESAEVVTSEEKFVAEDPGEIEIETAKVITGENKEEEENKEEQEEQEKEEGSGTVEYTVKPGDFLSLIAGNQMGNSSRWPEIVELNKDKYPSLLSNPNLIYAGWVLTLPTGSKGNTVTPNNTSNNGNNGGTVTGGVIANGQSTDSSGWGSASPCEPMPSWISSEYGPRDLFGHSFHHGIDIPVCSGTRVNAMANGTVIAAAFEPGGGNYVKIRYDNGYETFYCHLQSFNVSVGDRVEAGQQVALSDNTGQWTTGAHLHMGVYLNGQSVDPRSVYNGFPPKR